MKKVIIYGLGNVWSKNEKFIEKEYTIVGVCDKNQEKLKLYSNAYTLENIKNNQTPEYDYILITTESFFIYEEFIKDTQLPIEKVLFLQAEIELEKIKISPKPIEKFYGQEFEDAICKQIFEKIKKTIQQIKYLEIGTYDPVHISNMFYFYKKGASGTMIDANPLIKQKCNLFRKRDNFINCAVSDKTQNKNMKFYIAENFGLSSLDKNMIDEHKKLNRVGAEIKKTIEIPVIGINEILEKLSYIPDFVSIDIEGEDMKVIKAWNFCKYRPSVLIIELTGNEIVNYMKKQGYLWYTTVGANSIFVDEKYNL